MDTNWAQLGKQALWDLVGAPQNGSAAEWVWLGIAIVVLVVVFARISHMSDMVHAGPVLPILAVTLGVLSLVASWLVIDRWMLPMTGADLPGPVVRCLAVALSLVMTIPFMCLVLRAHVTSVLLAWGGALLAAALVLSLGRLGMEAAVAGSESAEKTKARSEEMQEFLNDQ